MKLDEMHDEADQTWIDRPVMGIDGWIGVTLLAWAFALGFCAALLLGAMR